MINSQPDKTLPPRSLFKSVVSNVLFYHTLDKYVSVHSVIYVQRSRNFYLSVVILQFVYPTSLNLFELKVCVVDLKVDQHSHTWQIKTTLFTLTCPIISFRTQSNYHWFGQCWKDDHSLSIVSEHGEKC